MKKTLLALLLVLAMPVLWLAAENIPTTQPGTQPTAAEPATGEHPLTWVPGGPETQYFHFEGDSLSSNDNRVPDWNQRVMMLDQFAGRGTRINVGQYGGVISSIGGRYQSYIYPNRVGQKGITKSWIFLEIGTNDAIVSDAAVTDVGKFGNPTFQYNEWAKMWDGYLATARADGFKLVVHTVMRRTHAATGHGSGFEIVRRMMNDHIRASTKQYDILIDLDKIFPNCFDTRFFAGDFTHMVPDGRQRWAETVNTIFRNGGALDAGLNPGVEDYQVPQNINLVNEARAYRAPQGYAEALLSGSTWDLNTAPAAFMNLNANVALANPTHMRQGFHYGLTVNQGNEGGCKLTFGTSYKNVPALGAASYTVTHLDFYSDGAALICVGSGSYVAAGSETLVADEEFTLPANTVSQPGFPKGSRALNNTTHPDTTNTLNHDYVAGGTIYVDPAAAGEGQTYGATEACLLDTGTSSHTVEARFKALSGECGLVVRATDMKNRFHFCINAAGKWEVFKVVGGSYGTLAAGATTGTFTYSTDGNQLKVVAVGNNMAFYIDGVLKTTVTDAFNNDATLAGFGWVNQGTKNASRVASWKAYTH